MSSRIFSRIYILAQKRRTITLSVLGAILVVCLIRLPFIRYNNNIELMLPNAPGIQNTMRFLREANFSDKLVISLRLTDGSRTTRDLISVLDQWAKGLKSPLVGNVISNVSAGNLMSEIISFLRYTPQLCGPEMVGLLTRMVTPQGVEERLKFIYRQSLSPGSSFMMPFLRADPLGISSGVLRDIEKLSSSLGYDVAITDGHLISRDGRHAMAIIKTPVILTDGFGSRKLIAYLKEKLKSLPDFVSADIIAGHMHTVSNEDVIKKDIRLTTTIAAIAFLLLFLIFFRDITAVMVFLIPLAAIVISTNITSLVFKTLSYFVIGLGTVIAGIAIDYGIYVYIAVRKAGRTQSVIGQIIRPVIFGAITTISVFAVFFFSSVKGYQQLAFFSTVSIIICLLLALFILPHFFRKEEFPLPVSVLQKFGPVTGSTSTDSKFICGWLILMAVMFCLGLGLRFKNDITQFDGAGKEVISAEETFAQTWGGKDLPAILVVPAKTLQEAYELNSEVYTALISSIGRDNVRSFAAIWPGYSTRQANLARWQEFLSPGKESELSTLLSKYGKEYNYSADAFSPFFGLLHQANTLDHEPEGFAFFDRLKEQFVFNNNDGYQIISYFPDQDGNIARLSRVIRNFPGAFLVSRKNFSSEVSHALGAELTVLSFFALFLTFGLTIVLLRDIRLAALAMVPVVSALIMITGTLSILRLPLNMPAIIAAMVVVGLVSDYGMFVVYYCIHRYETGTYVAVTFAAVTTLVGTGVLLFARHPMLFSIGLTLTAGVLSGFLSGVLVIPASYRLWIGGENRAGTHA